MPFIIGTDEAGYGPNLGPLLVGATLWEVPEGTTCLYSVLSDVICKASQYNSKDSGSKIPVGDSKDLYKSRGSIKTLEHAVLALLGLTSPVPKHFPDLLQTLAAPAIPDISALNTYRWDSLAIPATAVTDRILESTARLTTEFRTRGITLHRMAVTTVFPEEFNRGLVQFENKAGLLSRTTCQLAKHLLENEIPTDQDVKIICDKHGGRAHYAGCLQQDMTPEFVTVLHESKDSSHYVWSEPQRKVAISFFAKGEKYLPIGLASMVAKYIREMCMTAWNNFWCEQLPGLKPTAGYPQDAKRFKRDIAPAQAKLALKDPIIWRNK